MGEVQGREGQLSFNGSIRISGGDERLSSMGGALLLRELDERLAVTGRLCRKCGLACMPWPRAMQRSGT